VSHVEQSGNLPSRIERKRTDDPELQAVGAEALRRVDAATAGLVAAEQIVDPSTLQRVQDGLQGVGITEVETTPTEDGYDETLAVVNAQIAEAERLRDDKTNS